MMLIMRQKCSFDECQNPRRSRQGWCSTHYERWRRHGDPLGGTHRMPQTASVEERFWAKVNKTESCWLWTASRTRDGYGQFQIGKSKMVRAHRFCYEMLVGPVPKGLMLDHRTTCLRRCVNPSHLRLVTNKQNGENRRRETKTRSGIRGVSWHARDQRWQGNVRHNGKLHHCGYHDTPEAAEAAVVAKRNELFTHNDIDLPFR